MSIPVIQVPSLILPEYWRVGTEHEDINDLVTHISREFYIADIHEKQANIVAIENTGGVNIPLNLQCWVELSPVPSTISNAYWSAIGGGGGIDPATGLPRINPVAPLVEAGTGVNGTTHTMMLAWAVHSAYARVVLWTDGAAVPANAYWQVQVVLSGKTP